MLRIEEELGASAVYPGIKAHRENQSCRLKQPRSSGFLYHSERKI
ncbi:MAG: hypothetical protein MR016_08305 [Agathobacter sp.]|nr:hypothetical protein [Agathobacter sp.]